MLLLTNLSIARHAKYNNIKHKKETILEILSLRNKSNIKLINEIIKHIKLNELE